MLIIFATRILVNFRNWEQQRGIVLGHVTYTRVIIEVIPGFGSFNSTDPTQPKIYGVGAS